MTIKIFPDIRKAVRLPLFSNRPDERLLNNRIWLPFTRNSWAGLLKCENEFENVKMKSDGKRKFKQDTHHRAALNSR